jgi:hypothetical protein
MYSTACNRQKGQTKHNPQQAPHKQPTEAQKKTPTLKLPNLEIQSGKTNSIQTSGKAPDDGCTGQRV